MVKITPGDPYYLKTGEKGLETFTDTMLNSIEGLNENLGFGSEGKGVRWSSQWLDTGAQFLTLRQGIQAARKEIPELMDKKNESEIGLLMKKIFHDRDMGGLLIPDKVTIEISTHNHIIMI